jgi:hypothetical protein
MASKSKEESKEDTGWTELTIVRKRVAKVRGTYGSLRFELSGKAEPEWSEALRDAAESDDEAKEMKRNPGPSVDGEVILWEVFHDDMETAWRVLKAAIDVANEKYARILAARQAREAQLQSRLDDRDKLKEKLDDRLQALK